MGKKELNPVHPGEVLLKEFLKPMGLSQNRLALDIGVHPRRINEIVLRKRSLTADTALRLARHFGNSPQFWLGLQRDYDLDIAAEALGDRLASEVRVSSMARESRVPYGRLRRGVGLECLSREAAKSLAKLGATERTLRKIRRRKAG
jgi:addiction module HigA family antidote